MLSVKMKRKHSYLIMAMVVALLVGCTPKVEYSITPSQPQNGTLSPIAGTNVVILPLADYSAGNRLDEARRRQAKVMASVKDQMRRIGLIGAIQEDVNTYLLDHGIIGQIHSANVEPMITYFSSNQWGDSTNAVVTSIEESISLDTNPVEAVGLNPVDIYSISAAFQAGYLLRGRIIEYELRKDHSYNPGRIGLLPFFFNSTNSALFGVAKTETYDMLQDITIGFAAGAALGSVSNAYDDGAWGAIGAATGALAKGGGQLPEAVVQLELALQEPSGRVVWSNRAEVKVALPTVFGDPANRNLLDQAIDEATGLLISDMGRQMFGMTPAPTVAGN